MLIRDRSLNIGFKGGWRRIRDRGASSVKELELVWMAVVVDRRWMQVLLWGPQLY